METKLLEVRDNVTCMPILAVKLIPGNGTDAALIARAGFGNTLKEQEQYIIIVPLENPSKAEYAPYQNSDPWYAKVHKDIIEHWSELDDGDVVDPGFYSGDRKEPLPSDVANDRLKNLWEMVHGAKEKT